MPKNKFKPLTKGNAAILAALAVISFTVSGFANSPAASAAPTSVQNPSLEQVTNGTPNCFEQSGWGTNTANWSLTTAAHTGTVAQAVAVSGYTNGDRKLLMTENTTCAPAVTPGATYNLSVWYESTSAANSLTVFTHSGAGWTYWTDLKTLPAAAGWTLAVWKWNAHNG
jgi:hypothetical protein